MNTRKIIAITSAVSMLLGATPFIAASKGSANWSLPAAAVQVETDVFYLGTKKDPHSHRLVEGYAFIHRSANANARASKGGGTTACYSYIARGAKWQTNEPWVMNPNNARGLNTTDVFNLERDSVAKWEDAADGIVGNGVGVDVFGAGSSTTAPLVADSSSPDGANEVYFADISGANTIGVTTVWGIFSGPANGRLIIEWDQVYDDVSFDWSAGASGVTGKMDFENIATHEIGHAFGLGHPSSGCTEESMYAYANTAETKKRDLNPGDISGINLLY